MTDALITFLKDDSKAQDWSLYFMAGLIALLMLKYILKSRIKPVVFDRLISFVTLLLFVLVIGNVLATKNYDRLWTMLFIALIVLLQRVGPKLVKWYDHKIDRLGEKM